MTKNSSNLPSPYILRRLEVFNWGPFHGRHCADININGSAIIGPTGSGKTTLVDALMTLLVARPKYNLASTGGHESDRDLISYIRGVTGAGNRSDNNHVSRQGKTTTGICACFNDGESRVLIGAVLWIDGISFAAKDQKDLWFYSINDEPTLEQLLTLHQDGGARALKQYGRETDGLRVFDTKKAYLAQLRQRFEVSDNAFSLLNRAAGLKQLNSIDEIFRELVLEDRSAFSRAIEVANEFDDLSEIRTELETARQQEQSLSPIAPTYKRFQECKTDLDLYEKLLSIMPVWYAVTAVKKWNERTKELDQKLDELNGKIKEKTCQEDSLKKRAEGLQEIYLQVGGADIELIKNQIEGQNRLLEERRKNVEQYLQMTRNLKLDEDLSRESLYRNQQKASALKTQQTKKLEFHKNERLEVAHLLVEAKEREDASKKEIEEIKKRPGSNISSNFQEFRALLADELELDEGLLPFVAQLVQVKSEESQWQGAIERAIGSNRLRILVPSEKIQQALSWINNRNNRLYVRLLEVRPSEESVQFMQDGFTRKLDYKQHPYRQAVKALLATWDRHCVSSPDILRQTPHSMTMQGLMSGKRDFFEKQDQVALSQGWVTGFDNKHLLASLALDHKKATEDRELEEQRLEIVEQKITLAENKIIFVNQLIEMTFDTIDTTEAERELHAMQERLALLSDPDSEVSKARKSYEQVKGEAQTCAEEIKGLHQKYGGIERECNDAERKKKNAEKRAGNGLNNDQQEIAQKHFSFLDDRIDLNQIDQLEYDERQRLQALEKKISDQKSKLEKDLIRQMGQAQRQDTGALAEVGTEIGDISSYLERLKILTEEALPSKLERFLNYLNQSSDQGVTQLLSDIVNEVSLIEERIFELNQTLQRVDFQVGQYLQLVPQRVVHESLSTLETARRYLNSAALKDDQGESHYKALQHVVTLLRDAGERKNTVGAKALLDPRYRLQFSASVKDRHTQKEISQFKGSQSGSGGEKEIIASYILTASLSYALCPSGMTRPLFGTIVLDEAFSKSSQAVAGRIIKALREFGLHPLFITPNKEMRLLRNHTQSAILVHRKGMKAALTSMSWEELEAEAEKRIKDHSSV